MISCYNCASSYRKFLIKEMIYGKIIVFYIDNEQHLTPTFILSGDSRKLSLLGMEQMCKNVTLGDTLKKDSNSLDFYLIKKDTILVFNPKCNGSYVYE